MTTALRTAALLVAASAVSFAAGWLVRDLRDVDAIETEQRAEVRVGEAAAAVRQTSERGPEPAPRDGANTRPRADSSAVSRPTTVAVHEERLMAAWDAAHSDGRRPSAGEFEYAAQQARDRTANDLEYAARAADARLDEQLNVLRGAMALQAKRGVAPDGPATLELRVRGRERIDGGDAPGKLAGPSFDPLDAGDRASEGSGVVGPVPAYGRKFVVERVEIEARLGRSTSDEGRIEVSWPGSNQSWKGRSARIRAVFEGVSRPVSPSDIKLDASDAVARVLFVGRVVAADDAPDKRPFEWRPDQAVGFLRDDAPVRIQIVADHGGGNPRSVFLTGGTSRRFEEFAQAPVWDETAELEKLRRSTCWTQNTGLMPPGSAFRLTRIDWRARLLGGQSHSRFDVTARAQKEPLVTVGPSSGARSGQAELLTGTWNGDLLIRADDMDELQFTCHYYGMADVTVFGRLEREKR